MRSSAVVLSSLGLVALAIACTSKTGELDNASSGIKGGEVDSEHTAVVALLNAKDELFCTGTVVKTKDDGAPHEWIGWILTSGSCVLDGPVVAVAPKTDSTVRKDAPRFQVVDSAKHPEFKPEVTLSPHNVGIVRIVGVNGIRPIPVAAATNEPIPVGTEVRSVGFGATEPGAAAANTKRHGVTMTVASLDQGFLTYNSTTKGLCAGDRGGPVLRTQGSDATVVGVHHGGTTSCTGEYRSEPVATNLGFIQEQFAKALPEKSCKLVAQAAHSGKAKCKTAMDTCLADAECTKFVRCMQGSLPMLPLADKPKPEDHARCSTEVPLGIGPYDAAVNCGCTVELGDTDLGVCAGEARCGGVPRCGFARATDLCATCLEVNRTTCEAEANCAADGECRECLVKDGEDPRCVKNDLFKKFSREEANECVKWCGPKDGKDGDPGKDGKDGDAGRDGHDGLDGRNGDAGPAGPAGPAGGPGPAGGAGPAGPAGPGGEGGPQGPVGPAADPGPNGKEGPRGPTGKTGEDACNAAAPGSSTSSPFGVMAALAAIVVASRRRKRSA